MRSATATQWAWRSTQRYYAATLTADLFETPVLVLQWGGLDSHRGGMKTLVVDSDEHGRALVQKIDKRRQSRGYRVVDGDESQTPLYHY